MRKQRIDLRGKYYTIKELENYRNQLASQANKNLLELERAGYKQYAYSRAVQNIRLIEGGKKRRFKKKKSGYTRENLESLRTEIEAIEAFLDYKTGTVEGAREYEEKVTSAFRKKGYSLRNSKDFFSFLSSRLYDDLANRKIDSEILQEYYDRMTDEGYSDKQIRRKLQQYEKGNKSVKDLYEDAGLEFIKVSDSPFN